VEHFRLIALICGGDLISATAKHETGMKLRGAETGSYDLSLIRGEVTLSLLWVASSLEACNEMPEVPA
jgi:hypothetical protein